MRKDPIVEEVRHAREEHAAKFNYDLDLIFQDLKEKQMKSNRKIVSFINGENLIIKKSNNK